MMKKIAAAIVAVGLCPLSISAALAQSSPSLTFGQVPTPAQWNSYFSSKQDTLGFTPMNVNGGTFLGRVVTAPPSGTTAGFNITPGSTPGSPADGDLWATSAGLFVRINGGTVGPLVGTGTPCTLCAVKNATNTFTASQIINGTLTLNPATNTIAQGILINQTLPAGTQSPEYDANLTTIVNGGYTATASGFDTTYGLFNALSVGQRLNYLAAGSGGVSAPIQIGSLVAAAESTSGQQLVGFHASAASNIASAGVDAIWGFTGYVYVGPLANMSSAIAVNPQVGTRAGSVIASRIGIEIDFQGDGTAGSTTDAAIVITTLGNPFGGGASTPVKDAINLFSGGGGAPLATTGSVIKSAATFTATNFASLPTTTFTGKIFDFGSTVYQMDGSGNFTSGAGVIKSSSATAFAVGPNGATNPAFLVNASNGSSVTGLSVASQSLGNGLSVAVISSGTDENLALNAKGAGVMTFGNVSTGAITLSRATTASVSISSPIHTASGALTFQSNGSTLAGTITTAQKWGLGAETNPQSTLVVSNSATTGIAGIQGGLNATIRAVGANGGYAIFEADTFAQQARFAGARADGTAASPAAIAGADVPILNFNGAGYDGTSYYTGAAWILWSTQAYTAGSHGGMYMTAYTTPNNTQTITEAMRIQASGGVSIGVTTDPGIGNLLVSGMYRSSTAPTAVSGAGPILIGSGSTINSRMKVNLNGTDYWIPVSTTAF